VIVVQPLGHVRALDGIRGLAIAGVLADHFLGLPGGSYGVDLFFVLSGFLITTLLLEEHDQGGISLRRFYERRARRLLPGLGALLLGVGIICAVDPVRDVELLLAGGLYVSNFARVLDPALMDASPFGHLWSLATEEQFYVLWPPLLIILLRRRARVLRGLLLLFVALVGYRILVAALGGGANRIWFAPDTHADGLVLGCVIAYLRRRGLVVRPWCGYLALGAFAALCVTAAPGRSEPYLLGLVEVAAAVAILAAPGMRALALAPLVWLGMISYSVYLWQQPVAALGQSPLGLPFAILLGLLSYRFVERPFRRRRSAVLVPAAAG
jgi:peptidoglycan/LPS O-acetylase OafA/YrhL